MGCPGMRNEKNRFQMEGRSMSFRPGASRGEILIPEVSEAALRLRLLTFVRSDKKERVSKRHEVVSSRGASLRSSRGVPLMSFEGNRLTSPPCHLFTGGIWGQYSEEHPLSFRGAPPCHFEERSDEKSCPPRCPKAVRSGFLTPLSRGFGMTS